MALSTSTSQSACCGAIMIIDDPQDGNGIPIIRIHQVPLLPGLIHPNLVRDKNLRSQAPIESGPVSIDYYVDLASETFSVTVSVLGIRLGTFSASLDKGMVLNVSLLVAKGTLTFYTQDGGLYMCEDLKISLGDNYSLTVKIVQYK